MGDWVTGGNRQVFSTVGLDVLARPTAVYPSLSANTKGAWIELEDSSLIDANAFTVVIPYVYGSSDYLVDIGIGAAGAEQVVVANLSVSQGNASYSGNTGFSVDIPVPIPSGTRIAARVQATGTSSSRYIRCEVLLQAGGYSTGGAVTTLGANVADSGGVSVDPGAADNTKGAWSEITAATTVDIKSLFACFGNRANTGRTDCNWLVDIGVGGAGSEEVIIPNAAITANAYNDSLSHTNTPWYDLSIPTGTRIAARASCTIVDSTDRLFDIVLYGIT